MEQRHSHHAFTLIEALVCIAIIALLVGLMVPLLGLSRAAARKSVALANMKDTALVFSLYANQYNDSFPWHPGDAFVFDHPPEQGSSPNFSSGDPFGIRYTWVVTMHKLAPWPDHYRTWTNPGVNCDRDAHWRRTDPNGTAQTVWPSYYMSSALAGEPSVWIADGPPGSPRGVRHSDVAFPSAKAMLIDVDRAYLTRANDATTLRLVCSYQPQLNSVRVRRMDGLRFVEFVG